MAGGPGSYVIGEEEVREVMEVIQAGHLYRYGQEDNPKFLRKVLQFEKMFSEYMDVKYSIATCNGTSSLLVCLAALGIGPGDEVIVPGYTFIASISSIIIARAIPVLAEIDESLTIDPADIEKKITPRTKAIMPVHMLGNLCDMDKIMAIAKKHNLYVIEDCCQAVGGSYKGKKCGAFGDINAYSLNYHKTITSGDGGAVVTNDYELYEKAYAYHDQGHKPTRTGVEIGKRSVIGADFRMNELTGAVAIAQLRKLDNIIDTLRRKKARLKSQIKPNPHYRFRVLNDADGEIATLFTFIFDTKENAGKIAELLDTKPVSTSGWHVYNNMEQILGKKTLTEINCPFSCGYYGKEVTYSKNMLPQTDDILDRAINISVGVVDKGLGAGFGINIHSTDEEIDAVPAAINATIAQL